MEKEIIKTGTRIEHHGVVYRMIRLVSPFYSISECGQYFQEHWTAWDENANEEVIYLHRIWIV